MAISQRWTNLQGSINELENVLAILKFYNENRDMSKAVIIEKLGLTELQFDKYMRNFFDGMPQKAVKKFGELEDLYRAAQTPLNKLLSDVFCNRSEEFVEFPEIDEEYFWEEWLPQNLSERECKYVTQYYLGIDKKWYDEDTYHATYHEIAKSEKVTTERIRQIIVKAFRKLRHPSRIKSLFFPDLVEKVAKENTEIKALCRAEHDLTAELYRLEKEHRDLQERTFEVRVKVDEITKNFAKLTHNSEILDNIEQSINELNNLTTPAQSIKINGTDVDTKVLDMTLDDLDFTVRTTNCLRRAGLKTVADIISVSKEEMMKVRNLGKNSLEEIEYKLEDLNLSLRDERIA